MRRFFSKFLSVVNDDEVVKRFIQIIKQGRGYPVPYEYRLYITDEDLERLPEGVHIYQGERGGRYVDIREVRALKEKHKVEQREEEKEEEEGENERSERRERRREKREEERERYVEEVELELPKKIKRELEKYGVKVEIVEDVEEEEEQGKWKSAYVGGKIRIFVRNIPEDERLKVGQVGYLLRQGNLERAMNSLGWYYYHSVGHLMFREYGFEQEWLEELEEWVSKVDLRKYAKIDLEEFWCELFALYVLTDGNPDEYLDKDLIDLIHNILSEMFKRGFSNERRIGGYAYDSYDESIGVKKSKPKDLDIDIEKMVKGLYKDVEKEKLKSPIGWPGGKSKLVNEILKYIPEHKVYVEPFVGSGAVFFAKDLVETNVISDIDEKLMRFYKYLREIDDIKVVIDKYGWPDGKMSVEDCRKLYDVAFDVLENDVNDKEKYVWAFLFANKFSYGRKVNRRNFNPSATKPPKCASKYCQIKTLLENFDEYKKKLQNAIIEVGDYKDVMKKYDSEETFFYLDPPYIDTGVGGDAYVRDVNEFNVEEMFEFLNNIKGKFLLSYKFDEKILRLVKRYGFKYVVVDTVYEIGSQYRGKKKARELLVANYDIDEVSERIRKFLRMMKVYDCKVYWFTQIIDEEDEEILKEYVPKVFELYMKEVASAGVFWYQYAGLTKKQSERVNKILKEVVMKGKYWNMDYVVNKIVKEVGVSRSKAEVIARTELAYISNLAREVAYRTQTSVEKFVYHTEPDACEKCKRIAEMSKDGVSLDELKWIVKIVAGATARGFLAHPNCRCVPVRKYKTKRLKDWEYLRTINLLRGRVMEDG